MFKIRYSLFAILLILYSLFSILYSLFFILHSPIYASGLTVTPPFQEILASGSAVITYQNQTAEPITLNFSLQKIIATDLLGRLQFNAPLPQTLQNTDPGLAEINPNELALNPGESATVSARFDPDKLDPGTTAFLLLARINPTPPLLREGRRGRRVIRHHPGAIPGQFHPGYRPRWSPDKTRAGGCFPRQVSPLF
jgi:hypothetical protein